MPARRFARRFASPRISSRFGDERRIVEKRAERLRLEQAPPSCLVEIELPEHGAGGLAPALGACSPLGYETGAKLLVALGRVEDPLDDELRSGRAVPGVLLEAKGEVVPAGATVAVEL